MTEHKGKTMPKPIKWIACHDTLVCAGAKQIQKWCVREGSEKGPLVAVMLTKDVAHALAAAPDMIAALARAERLFKEALPKFNWGKSALDANAIELLNEVPGEVSRAIAKADVH
jgi:hypothetical protein